MGTLTTSYDRSIENDILRVFGYFYPTSVHIRNHEIYDHLRVAVLSGPGVPNFLDNAVLEASMNINTNAHDERESVTITYTWKKALPFDGVSNGV